MRQLSISCTRWVPEPIHLNVSETKPFSLRNLLRDVNVQENPAGESIRVWVTSLVLRITTYTTYLRHSFIASLFLSLSLSQILLGSKHFFFGQHSGRTVKGWKRKSIILVKSIKHRRMMVQFLQSLLSKISSYSHGMSIPSKKFFWTVTNFLILSSAYAELAHRKHKIGTIDTQWIVTIVASFCCIVV